MRVWLTGLAGLILASSPVCADEPAQKQPAPAATPQWIWADAVQPKQTVLLKTDFEAPNDTQFAEGGSAQLIVAADNSAQITLNGQKVGRVDQWQTPLMADVAKMLRADKPNTLVIRATNDGGEAGAVAQLTLTGSWSGQRTIVSDDSWQVSRQIKSAKDRKWAGATVQAPLGKGPWAKQVNAELFAKLGELKEPETTPADSMKTLPGFTVELVYDVPQNTQGSWVNLCVAGDRLVASDQYGKLYWVTPGATRADTQVEPMDLEIGFAQGLLWAFDSLYVMTNSRDKYGSAFYRCRDTDGDGELDDVAKLITFQGGGGEHGPHAIVPTPDGEGLYLVLGNQTEMCDYTSSRVPEVWDEDILLPRVYGKGFMRSKMAPGGYVLRVDPEAKERELVSVGYRNQYDAAVNWRGDLFTYDADMEWDWNTPWYRPTRVCEVASGSDYGWRNGSAKWPARWPDSYSPITDIGPGSPTGVTFGYGAQFPAKYQDALYICDWTYGKLYAIHLTEEGAGYAAKREEFVIGTPLPLTDAVVFPGDGALYFALGGRRIKSGLYRVRYVGDESTEPAARAQYIPPLHELRHELEELHASPDPERLAFIVQHLGHEDGQIRYAARTALEQLGLGFAHEANPGDIETSIAAGVWNPSIDARLQMTMAIARIGDAIRLDLDRVRETVLESLLAIDFAGLPPRQKVDYLRTIQLVLIRMGEATEDQQRQIVGKLGGQLGLDGPRRSFGVQNDLYEILVHCGDPQAASKGVALLEAAATQEHQIAFAKSLRLVDADSDWTPELRDTYFEWFVKARGYRGGASFELFVDEIKNDALKHWDGEALEAAKAIVNRPRETDELAAEPREFVRKWTLDDAWPLVESGLSGGRDFENGRQMFAAAKCAACHRYGTDGGAIGPDLTALAGRFSAKDLLTHTLDPNKEISDQYAATTFLTVDGRVINGRVVNLSGDTLRINENMLDPNATVTVDRKMIEMQKPSPVSMMPAGLLDTLAEPELLDLMAYLLSRGDAEGPMFQER